MSYEFEAEQQAYDPYFQEQETVPCPKCGRELKEVVSHSAANDGRVFYSCNTKPEYGDVCRDPKGFFGWKDERRPDGTWPPPQPRQQFPAKRPRPAGSYQPAQSSYSRPMSSHQPSGYASAPRSPPAALAHTLAPSAASSTTPAPQPQTAGPHPIAGALKAMAEHITDVETKLDQALIKIDCLVALLRARKEEEEDSQSALPRPASSTA